MTNATVVEMPENLRMSDRAKSVAESVKAWRETGEGPLPWPWLEACNVSRHIAGERSETRLGDLEPNWTVLTFHLRLGVWLILKFGKLGVYF